MIDRVKELLDILRDESNCNVLDYVDEAADLIESLAAELEQVKQERDAAVEDLEACCPCEVCTRSCTYDKVNAYDKCAYFKWRGAKR